MYNLDPFQQHLAPKRLSPAADPMTEEQLIRRQNRLDALGLGERALGDINRMAMKNANKREGMQKALSESAARTMGGKALAASM